MLGLKAMHLEYYIFYKLETRNKIKAILYKYFVFSFTLIFRQEWSVCGSFNIQYQNTGIDALHSLGKIKLERSIPGVFSYIMAVSDCCL